MRKGVLLPFQGDGCTYILPRALPWAMCLLAFQADIPIVVMVKYHAAHGFCQAVDYFKLTHHYIT